MGGEVKRQHHLQRTKKEKEGVGMHGNWNHCVGVHILFALAYCVWGWAPSSKGQQKGGQGHTMEPTPRGLIVPDAGTFEMLCPSILFACAIICVHQTQSEQLLAQVLGRVSVKIYHSSSRELNECSYWSTQSRARWSMELEKNRQ